MLTELRIANFKAFGSPQRVPIKPLTLIFGANSSGKSSIIHSLLLARHIWDGGAADARALTGLADSVELGGFSQFVHGQTLDRRVELEMRFAIPPRSTGDLLRKGAGGETLSSRIHLAWSDEADRQPEVALSILDAEDSVLWSRPHWKDVDQIRLLVRLDDRQRKRQDTIEKLREQKRELQAKGNQIPKDLASKMRQAMDDAIADYVEELRETTAAYLTEKPGPLVPRIPQSEEELRDRLGDDEVNELFGVSEVNHALRQFLSEVSGLLAPDLTYLGPLRYRPGRIMAEPDLTDPTWQAGGGAAYWRLQRDAETRASTNDRLTKLGSEYQLEVITWSCRERPGVEKPELVLKDRQDRRLSFGDVGAGISQVLPVLVAAGAPTESVIAIEQPEIHLHPALQAELGDIFIESALGERKNTFILETHSEHLILRILRRIRETNKKASNYPQALPPVTPEDVSVLFVEQMDKGSIVRQMEVNERGEFVKAWPGGFFEEDLREIIA